MNLSYFHQIFFSGPSNFILLRLDLNLSGKDNKKRVSYMSDMSDESKENIKKAKLDYLNFILIGYFAIGAPFMILFLLANSLSRGS